MKKFALVAASLCLAGVAHAQYGARNGEWRYWGGDAGSTRYSPLDQINAKNAKDLEFAWRWQAPPISQRGEPDTNWQGTPVVAEGVMYVTAGRHQVAALDPETGKTLWLFTPEPKDLDSGRPGNPTGRSVAYWTDGKQKRVFRSTLDGRLISIDASSGKADAKFGKSGTVMLNQELWDGPVPVLGSTSPPMVVGDVLVVQVVPEVYAPQKEATPGHIRGYDVRTGKRLWTFHTIPQAGEFGVETWEKDSWKYSGNTGVWTMMSADLELGYVYLPVETPSHDFYGGHRLGDNLYAESLVCLDAKTGKRVWHFQIVHHGVWDYDPPAAPILGDIVVDGKRIKSVTQLTKQGMSFVFDRATGKPVWPIEEKPVPQSDVPGERLSPTQPFPTKPAPYEHLGYDENQLIDFTPELRKEAIEIASRYVQGPIYMPTSAVVPNGKQGTWVQPGYGGGSNWNGGAFDPETGMMFVPTKNSPMVSSLTPADPKHTNLDYIRATTLTVQGPRGLPVVRPPWSKITATDMNAGEHRWVKPIGGAPDSVRNHPALKGLKLDFASMGQVNVRPSPLATKTLLFMGEAGALGGDPGGKLFRAYNKATGEVVAEIPLPAKPSGAPMTYLHKGQQYIAITVATREHPAELVVMALPQPGKRRQTIVHAPVPIKLATRTAATGDVNNGRRVYGSACAICHGQRGEGIEGAGPSLTTQVDSEKVSRIVIGGGVNMPGMRTTLTAEQIRDVTFYVVDRLNAANAGN
jgi:quinoprotein glucose dehydrogenase